MTKQIKALDRRSLFFFAAKAVKLSPAFKKIFNYSRMQVTIREISCLVNALFTAKERLQETAGNTSNRGNMSLFFLLRIFTVSLLFAGLVPTSICSAFSFTAYEKKLAEEDNSSMPANLDTLQCPASMQKAKIAVMIGQEFQDGRRRIFYNTGQKTGLAAYKQILNEFNAGFSRLGLTTATAEEINEQIAQEEQEAFLNNDLDAALSASSRLGAKYMIQGNISTTLNTNRMVDVDEIFITVSLFLVDRKGKRLSTATVSDSSYTDANIAESVGLLITEKADSIVATLFSPICNGEKN